MTFRGNRRNDVSLTEQGQEQINQLEDDREAERVVAEFDDYSATDAEEESLERLGIERHEKDQYRLTHVSEIIADN